MAWSAVKRVAGSNSSRRWIKSLARLDTEGQGCGIEEAEKSDCHQCPILEDIIHIQTLWKPTDLEMRCLHRFKTSSKQDARFHSNKAMKLLSQRSAGLTSRTNLKGKLNVTGQREAAVLGERIRSLGGRTASAYVCGIWAHVYS